MKINDMRETRTQGIARRAHDLRERKEIERDPLVQAVLDMFPGAEIAKIVRKPLDGEPL
jgi:hypothetical protein